MKEIIFKNATKVKTYKEIATANYGVYSKGELIRVVKTDNLQMLVHAIPFSEFVQA